MTDNDLRSEFAHLASAEGSNIRALCRRYEISPTTGYKWLQRLRAEEPFSDRSRRPHSSPLRTAPETEELIVSARAMHPTWGARKLSAFLREQGCEGLPSPSTVTEILRRRGLLNASQAGSHRYCRFEKERPNEMWQMDFKGHFELQNGRRCRPFTVMDDCSRYLIQARACYSENTDTVWQALRDAFRIFGLPQTILCDNGAPWGTTAEHGFTGLAARLLLYGVEVIHGRPYHPETQGKLERWHRTLKADLIARRTYYDAEDFQRSLDAYRVVYNTQRPHEALGMQTPSKVYAASPRSFPEKEPEPFFDEGAIVRKVFQPGVVSLKGRQIKVPEAFIGLNIGLKETETDGTYDVVFCGRDISRVSVRCYSKYQR